MTILVVSYSQIHNHNYYRDIFVYAFFYRFFVYYTYFYISNTNKLSYVSGQPTPNYSYNENGQMIIDSTKELHAEYDPRGLTTQMTLYGSDFDLSPKFSPKLELVYHISNGTICSV